MHCPDRGDQENAHELPPEKLKQRDVVYIDIANDNVLNKVSVDGRCLMCSLDLLRLGLQRVRGSIKNEIEKDRQRSISW